MKIIIDTDPGHDDVMALLYLLANKSVEVLAITTVAGNSTIENTTRNAQYVLDLMDEPNIPLFSGAAKPLKRLLIQAVVHGASGLDGINPTNPYKLTNDAPEQIINLLQKYPGEVSILAVGPLTNIAAAITLNRQAMCLAKEIVIMGGAFSVPGNKNRVAEFNIFVDPEAAAIVLDLPVRKVFVPLDACNDIQLTLKDFAAITNSTIRKALLKMCTPYITNLKSDMDARGALMYDALAAFYVCNQALCQSRSMNIQIETKGQFTRGMTIIDRRPVPDRFPINSEIVTNIPEKQFVQSFTKTLSNYKKS